jgi:phosphate/sulfate permease
MLGQRQELHSSDLIFVPSAAVPCTCSSTPATVGAIAGVGLWEGRKGSNPRLLLKMISGWIVTIIAAVSITCLFMAQGLYAPSKNG